jgi:hypothetical protein
MASFYVVWKKFFAHEISDAEFAIRNENMNSRLRNLITRTQIWTAICAQAIRCLFFWTRCVRFSSLSIRYSDLGFRSRSRKAKVGGAADYGELCSTFPQTIR